jgi:hypothetical protein
MGKSDCNSISRTCGKPIERCRGRSLPRLVQSTKNLLRVQLQLTPFLISEESRKLAAQPRIWYNVVLHTGGVREDIGCGTAPNGSTKTVWGDRRC